MNDPDMRASIEREPRRVRPPYDQRDDRFDHLRATDTEAWRVAVRLDRLAALLEPLADLDVSDYEHRLLEHLAAGHAHRGRDCRAAAPCPRGRSARRVTAAVLTATHCAAAGIGAMLGYVLARRRFRRAPRHYTMRSKPRNGGRRWP